MVELGKLGKAQISETFVKTGHFIVLNSVSMSVPVGEATGLVVKLGAKTLGSIVGKVAPEAGKTVAEAPGALQEVFTGTNASVERSETFNELARGNAQARDAVRQAAILEEQTIVREAQILAKEARLKAEFEAAAIASRMGGRTIIIDENLSPRLVEVLNRNGFRAVQVVKGTPDALIAKEAAQSESIILTNNLNDIHSAANLGRQGTTIIGVPSQLSSRSSIPELVRQLINLSEQQTVNPTEVLTPGTKMIIGR